MKINFGMISTLILVFAILLFSFSVYLRQRTYIREENYSLDIAAESVGWWAAGPTIRYVHDSGYRFSAGDEMAIVFSKLYYPIFDEILFNISIFTITLKPYGYDSFPDRDIVHTVRYLMDNSPYRIVFNETPFDGYYVELYVKYNGSEWKNRVTDFTVQLIYHTNEDKHRSTLLIWSSILFFAASPVPLLYDRMKKASKRKANFKAMKMFRFCCWIVVGCSMRVCRLWL